MEETRKFEDLKVYRDARSLTSEIFRYTSTRLRRNENDLAMQLRRAALSVPSNIAEGFERDGNREFRQFLAVAKGSVGELRSHLHICRDLELIEEELYLLLVERALEVSRQLSGLMRYIRGSAVHGRKYRLGIDERP